MLSGSLLVRVHFGIVSPGELTRPIQAGQEFNHLGLQNRDALLHGLPLTLPLNQVLVVLRLDPGDVFGP